MEIMFFCVILVARAAIFPLAEKNLRILISFVHGFLRFETFWCKENMLNLFYPGNSINWVEFYFMGFFFFFFSGQFAFKEFGICMIFCSGFLIRVIPDNFSRLLLIHRIIGCLSFVGIACLTSIPQNIYRVPLVFVGNWVVSFVCLVFFLLISFS